jgi:hypothetical protein
MLEKIKEAMQGMGRPTVAKVARSLRADPRKVSSALHKAGYLLEYEDERLYIYTGSSCEIKPHPRFSRDGILKAAKAVMYDRRR